MTTTKHPRHCFHFKTKDKGFETLSFRAWARVKIPKNGVELALVAEYVRRSIKAGGFGNSQLCSMSTCGIANKDSFHHPVLGIIDWTYTRAYVVSKFDPDTRLPSECYVYSHRDRLARLNDSKSGQQTLLRMLQTEGLHIVKLTPPTRQPERPGRPRGRNTGERARVMGAKLRYAVTHRGYAETRAS